MDCHSNPARMRQTLSSSFSVSGTGVHSGKQCDVTVSPAAAGTGIVFRRIDLNNSVIPATHESTRMDKLTRQTTLSNSEGAEVCTIEHLLASLYCLKIDDAVVDMSSAEMPILDGSAKQWVKLIEKAGICPSGDHVPVTPVCIRKPFAFKFEHAEYSIFPSEDFRVTYYFHSFWKEKPKVSGMFMISPETFVKELADARTFCFFQEIEAALKAGFAMGGNLGNAVIIGRKGVINPGGLRFDDEPLRHKVLDFLGDLSLAGHEFCGHFIVVNGGHKANAAFVKSLVQELNSSC